MVFKGIINKFAIMAMIFFIAYSCSESTSSNENSLTYVSLREGWFPWAGYAGEVEAMEIDSLYGINLKIDQGADDIDPVKLVLSGQNDFGVASAEAIVLANQKGANLVSIGVINYKSATCYIALKDKNVNTLKDFEGKKIGILTGTETETIYRLLVKKNNLNSSKITEIEAPWDLTSFLKTNAYDIRPAFVYDELVTLDEKGIEYTIIKPEDYGVQLMGAVYFTTQKMIDEHPEIVQAFVNAIAVGWEKTFKNPDNSIRLLKEYDENVDAIREKKALVKGLDYFMGENGKVLYVSNNAWNILAESIVSSGKVKGSINIKKSYNNTFINNYHDNK